MAVVVVAVVLTAGLIASALAPAGVTMGAGAFAAEGAAASAAAAGGISGGEVIAGAAVVGGVTGAVTTISGADTSTVNAAQMKQSISSNSQTISIHAPQEAEWINSLKDATARGPHPNLFKSEGPSQLPPMMNMGGALVVVGGFQSLLQAPSLQVGLGLSSHITKTPRSRPKKPKKGRKPDGRRETPDNAKGKFENVKGRKGKQHKGTKEIFEKDQFHKDHYEIYRNLKDYENGDRCDSCWLDGGAKGL